MLQYFKIQYRIYVRNHIQTEALIPERREEKFLSPITVKKVVALLTYCCHSHGLDYWYEGNQGPLMGLIPGFNFKRKEHRWQNFSDPILSAYRCAISPPRAHSIQRCWACLSTSASTRQISSFSTPPPSPSRSVRQK